MALIQCPDCSRDVSTAAVSCPDCGAPIARAAETAIVGTPLVTTQATSKNIKTQQLMALFVLFMGLALAITAWPRMRE